ncbi:MAG: hypothetical protein JSW00_08795 [Thermoplasmata archaeon]|nr:MAG: hypothetical protein JSW00_08795 [Thermoplasmata archaeon]
MRSKKTSILLVAVMFVTVFAVGIPEERNVTAEGTETMIFEDDFESYAVGTFPSSGGWELIYNGKGTQYQKVVDTESVSGSQSLQLWGRPRWAATAQKELTFESEVIGFEVYIKTGSHSGTIENTGVAAFYNEEAAPWGLGFGLVLFRDNGEIHAVQGFGPNTTFLQTYEPDVWYKVKVILDKTVETYDVWIDDVQVAQDVIIWDTHLIEGIRIGSGHSGMYSFFDDVKVFEVITESPQEAIEDVMDDIEEMNLPKGLECSLLSKLENAIKSLDKGNDNAAMNKIEAFINEVEAQRGKKLTDAQADELIAAAEEILAMIN